MQKMLIVLSAPKYGDKFYANIYKKLIRYQKNYAKAISQYDDVLVLCDKEGSRYLKSHLPDHQVLVMPMEDIWMRDFSTVQPHNPVNFHYAEAAQGGSRRDAEYVREKFCDMANNMGIQYRKSKYILDGGNFVGDDIDKAIVTDRFLKDNKIGKEKGKEVLRELLGIPNIAIVPADDPEGLAHADGMVMFADTNTLFVNDYGEDDQEYMDKLFNELQNSFPSTKIVKIPVDFEEEKWKHGRMSFGSARGIYVNSTVSRNAIYMPQFGTFMDYEAQNCVRQHTQKPVVPIPSADICIMGGSARCLSWQVTGYNAQMLREAAMRME